MMDTIESHMSKIWDEIEKDIPGINHISFDLTKYPNDKIHFYGFFHPNNGVCEPFDSIDDLKKIIRRTKLRREILFRKFTEGE